MWVQCYDPLGNWPASTLAAALPVFVLLGLLAWGRLNAGRAALAGLSAACIMAFFVFGMPAEMILASAVLGLVFAAFRVVWLIVAAVFLYDIAVTTGQFEIMKASVASLSGDRRLQAVLVAFSFGAFIEGAAGFGAPVAISATFLVGLGFQPFQAALLCLIANTAPVAWGGIGTPLRTLSAVTGLDVEALSGTCGRILPLLSVLIPFWLVRTMTGWRNTLEVWLPLVVIGGLHLKVAKGAAVTGHEELLPGDLEKVQVDVVPLSSTGTAVFLAAVLSGSLLGLSPLALARLLASTIRRMVPAILAIACMLALGFVTKYSGMDAVLGLAFTRTGRGLYPIFGTLLGWLGVALTGSDTSSNVLFGNLQKITAIKLQLDPVLMASANSTGGVMGKMIDSQSIVVAAAATGEGGREGELLRAVLWHSLALALIVGLIVWVYAHILPVMVVSAPSSLP